MDTLRCYCPFCHADWRFWLEAPLKTDPIAALTCCGVCESNHRNVWTIYRKPRVTRRWIDPEPPK